MYIAFVVFTSVIVGLLTEKTIHIVWKIYILWKGRDSKNQSHITLLAVLLFLIVSLIYLMLLFKDI